MKSITKSIINDFQDLKEVELDFSTSSKIELKYIKKV